MPTPSDTRAILEALAAAHPGLAVKGKKTPYLAINGNMFAFVDPEGTLCLRFSEAERGALAAVLGVGPVLQYGATMRGYVGLPPEVLADQPRVSALFAQCVALAGTLKPKPTKR